MIGDQIRKLRKERKYTIQEVSKLSGVAASTISEVETGKRNVEMKTVVRIVNSLKGKIEIC